MPLVAHRACRWALCALFELPAAKMCCPCLLPCPVQAALRQELQAATAKAASGQLMQQHSAQLLAAQEEATYLAQQLSEAQATIESLEQQGQQAIGEAMAVGAVDVAAGEASARQLREARREVRVLRELLAERDDEVAHLSGRRHWASTGTARPSAMGASPVQCKD